MSDLKELLAEWEQRVELHHLKKLPTEHWEVTFIERLFAAALTERAEVVRLARGHDEYNRANRLLTADNDRLRQALTEQRGYLRRLKHRANVRGGDTSAMGIADEADEHIRLALGEESGCSCSCNGQGGGCCR